MTQANLENVHRLVATMSADRARAIRWRFRNRFTKFEIVCDGDCENDVDPFVAFTTMFPQGTPIIRGRVPSVIELLGVSVSAFSDELFVPKSAGELQEKCRLPSGQYPVVRVVVEPIATKRA